ncbi:MULTISPECIES: LTA synthase family protein [unclassified Kaistella]|uniref:LTA synthase family protein n=1 Tax=unclassified Kaistella TaxID=2762626 RepID=UPI00273678B4|nr:MULTISPECIES: alkaline phosphatase family protein [unclassified Kaistella]MDP2455014.1 sulfatase-like hydrolase/transferase [Kaistella sp. SH11-4b]MDP2456003.1 sulfatase-like hydrolase/transferase [Kaistella sp. SH40-3]MDP2460684.1 sulfatase-like hydrolase/transferase [Kaistella sp. SH19-2b]
MFASKLKPYLYLGLFYGLVSLIVRIIFIFHPITTVSFGFFESLKILFIGSLTDVFVFILASSIFALYSLFLSDSKYKKPYGYIIFGLFVLAFLYTAFVPGNIFKQYGGSFPEIAMAFIGLKTLLFGLMLFLPTQRIKIRNILYFIVLFLYVMLIIFNGVSEYFFWNEFGVRYNFIAVDYLIYTNEVIGNIMESYPVVPLFAAIFSLTLIVTWFIYKKTKDELLTLPTFIQKIVLLVSFVVLCGISLFIIPKLGKVKTDNTFAQEIQANSFPKFYNAFTQKELDFFQFYPTINQQVAESDFLKPFDPPTFVRNINPENPEVRKNVVLISIESLSAEFMEHYGNDQKIMPFLDSLADKSLMFTNLYATGNRTVRGLEALTLCIPPTAGESVVKRENNKNKFSTGSVFQSKGYDVKFLYGGYSYFDNMEDFYKGNGYEIVDRNNFKPEEITFANIWGVSDEDMAKKAIEVMNKEAKAGKTFFHHWMTVSNHRPFTYPDGRINILGTAKSRDGGVKYTDYSIRKFFEMAKKQPWYKNTVFVIVADHCASSAGKTELPMDKYRIPGMIFSEGFIEPQKFTQTMSQIDVMPTLFGLLNFKYQSKFLGQDVFTQNFEPKAYIATYQDLGLIKDNYLTIISPTKKVKQYSLSLQPSKNPEDFKIFYDETPVKNLQQTLVDDCIAVYQSVSFWLKENKLNK